MASQSRTSGSKRHGSAELVVGRDGRVTQVPRRSRVQLYAASLVSRPALGLLGLMLVLTVFVHSLAYVAVLLWLIAASTVWVVRSSRRFRPGSHAVRELVMTLPPTVRTRVLNIIAATDQIRVDLGALEQEPSGVRDGLDAVIVAAIDTARHLVEVTDYLHQAPLERVSAKLAAARGKIADGVEAPPDVLALEEQVGVIERLGGRRDALDHQLATIDGSLGVVHARVVQARIESEAAVEVTSDLLELRDSTAALVAGLEEVRAIGA